MFCMENAKNKILFLVFMFLIIVIGMFFVSCKSAYDTPPTSETEQIFQENTTVLRVEYSPDAKKEEITYNITNNSDEDYIYTNVDFKFQRYEDGVWNDYPFNESHVHTYEYWNEKIQKGESIGEHKIWLKNHFKLPVKKGYYRMVIGDLISNAFFIE